MFLFCEIKCWRTTFALTTCMIRPFLSASKRVGYSSLKNIKAHLDLLHFLNNKCFFSFRHLLGSLYFLHISLYFSVLFVTASPASYEEQSCSSGSNKASTFIFRIFLYF